jgi:hypothetical protein
MQAHSSGVPGDQQEETFEQWEERAGDQLARESIKPLRPWHRDWWLWKHNLIRMAARRWLGVNLTTQITVEHHELINGLRTDLEAHAQATRELAQSVNGTAAASGRVQAELFRLEQAVNLQRRYSSPEMYELEPKGARAKRSRRARRNHK